MTDQSSQDELSTIFEHLQVLRALLVDTQAGPPVPDLVTRWALAAVAGAQSCGLTLLRANSRPVTVAAVGKVPIRVDELQYEIGEGPCLEASEGSSAVTLVGDLALDDQWPRFAHRCVAETDVRSIFSVRLGMDGNTRAAMNFYSDQAHAFGEDDVGIGALFAPFAALALQNAETRRDAEELQNALTSSRQIGVAIGILMTRHLLTYENAFAQLAKASQDLNRKVRDLALDVQETGDLPTTPSTRRSSGRPEAAEGWDDGRG